MMQIEARTDSDDISCILDITNLTNNWDYPAYIQRIKKDGWTLDTVKQLILDRIVFKNGFYVEEVLKYRCYQPRRNGERIHKWLSKAVANNLFDGPLITGFLKNGNSKNRIDEARKAIRSVKSFDDLAELYTDNKIFEPLVSAYVAYAIGMRQK